MDSICVGVDAGGTSTTAALSIDGSYERSAAGDAANVAVRGVAAASATIVDVVRSVLAGAVPTVVAVGAAGVGSGNGADDLRTHLVRAFPDAHVIVTDDAEIALRASVPSGPGIVAIAGTGSIALAVNGDVRARVGGLGYLAGDEGSGFAIGMAATKLLGRVYDGRTPRDETTDLVARTLQAPDRPSLLAFLYGPHFAPARIASLAPAIVAFAGKGNRVSTKIVQQAALELGELVKAAARLASLIDASPTVVLAGGLFRENSMYSFLVETRIVGDLAGAAILRAEGDPARGALHMAEAARAAV
jgi:N-acetylglucosamine kinase-like BadF-type ATPase